MSHVYRVEGRVRQRPSPYGVGGESGPLSVSKSGSLSNVVVRVQVGKEFLDMRQNKREIKFIRVGDAVNGPAQGNRR